MIDGSAREIATEYGAARVTLAGEGERLLLLGHGAGGGIDAPDLQAVAARAAGLGWQVGLVEQPYRVAGRRAPAPAGQLDAAWLAVTAALRAAGLGRQGVVAGGRSSGARVACRTAQAAGALGVLALAFPLQPPGREVSRAGELLAVELPTLVVQGTRDPFGGPDRLPRRPGLEVHAVEAADHSFRARRTDGRTSAECLREVGTAAAGWLERR